MARPAVTKTTELSSIIGIDSADERLKKKHFSIRLKITQKMRLEHTRSQKRIFLGY